MWHHKARRELKIKEESKTFINIYRVNKNRGLKNLPVCKSMANVLLIFLESVLHLTQNFWTVKMVCK